MAVGDLITEPYQHEYDGELLGPDTSWGIESVDGWDTLPDLDTADYPLAGTHGSIPGTALLRGRRLAMTLYLEHDAGTLTDADIQAEVNRLKRLTQPRSTELELVTMRRDGTKVLTFARPVRRSLPTDLDFVYGSARAAIEWSSSDPVVYGVELTSTVVPVFVGSGGLSYPVTYDKDYGASGVGLTTDVPNDGDWETWPRFVITGPSSGTVTPVKIENVTTGEDITFSGLTIPAGSTLVIDTHPSRRTVLFTDGANRWNTVAGSAFWPIAPGGAALRFRASGDVVGVTVTAQTRDAYL